MMDYYETPDVTVNKLKERFDGLQKQKEDIKFYEDAVIDKFIESVRNSFNPQFPFDVSFFRSVWNDKDEKHDENMEILIEILQRHLFKGIKTINKVVSYGYDMYGICVYFTAEPYEFELVIPIRQNINRHNCTYGCEGEILVNWNMGEFNLLKQDEAHKCSWTTVWHGYNLDDCDYFNVG